MPSTCSERTGVTALLAALAWLFVGCTYAPAPSSARPPLPTALAGSGPLPAAELRELHEVGKGCQRGVLVAGPESVAFELRTTPASPPRPFVLLVPILAGGKDLMDAVASALVTRGFDVGFCDRVGGALRPGQRGADLDELFRRTVLHQRLLLRWHRQRSATPVPHFVLGLSLGGMVSTVVGALEPDLDGVAICLSGGDLADVVATSSEVRVANWRAWRHENDGVGDDHLRWELATSLQYEPLRYAAAIATERVLLVTAQFDTVVRRRNQDVLWEALGRPARLQVPLGHYSAALWFSGILDSVAEHFRKRMA